MKEILELAQEIVDIVLKDLADRKGFEEWWDDIDDDISLEIAEELVAKVASHLEATDE